MKITSLLLTAFLSAVICCTPAVKTDTEPETAENTETGTTSKGYINDSIGFEIVLNDNWSYYTSKQEAPEMFKSAFEKTEVLMVGNSTGYKCFLRCTAEKTEMPVKEYFPSVFEKTKNDLQPLYAKTTADNRFVKWSYKVKINGLDFVFVEGVFRSGEHVVRMGLWTQASQFDEQKNKIDEIISSTEIFENGKTVTLGQKFAEGLNDIALDFTTPAESQTETIKPCKDSLPLIYQVEHSGSTVYLMGSVHVGSKDFYPLAPVIDSVFTLSENLIVEINSNAPDFKEKSMQLMKEGMLEKGKTLKDVLSPSAYAKTEKVIEELGLPMNRFNTFKPWFLAVTLEVIFIQSMGYDFNYGIDLHFMNKAQKSDKNILQIESMEEQIALLKELNSEKFLLYSLESNRSKKEKINDLIKAYLCGERAKIEKILLSEYETDFKKIHQKLIIERNHSMSEYIRKYLENNEEPAFVVVGCGHVVGNEGIVELLKKQGLSVQKL
ncbi:MAG: TraB/GumN family protein [Chitinispirillaceae bacterium]